MLYKVLISVLIIYAVISMIYFFLQEKIIFYPQILPDNYQFQFAYPHEEVFLETEDARIHALHFKADSSRGVILYFHGNAGSLAGWGYISEDILPIGYDLFIVDYRGYGKSVGKLSEKALFKDAQDTYNHLLKHYQESDIVLFGRSIGTGIAAKIASENNPRKLILESPYYNFHDLAANHVPFLPHKWLMKYHFRTDKFIINVRCPVLILQGTKDDIVPPKSAVKLSKLLDKNQLEMHLIDRGGHNNLSSFPEYGEILEKFLQGS